MNSIVTEAWEFGGALSRMRTDLAWGELAGIAAICVLFGWISYRRAIRRLTRLKCFVLVLLRTGFLGVLLLCLANPVKVERVTAVPPSAPPAAEPPPAKPRKLAVVVDRSDSMLRADNRGRTRLDAALEAWRRLQPIADKAFATTSYFSFGRELRTAPSLAEAIAQRGGGSETQLYHSLAEVLKTSSAGDMPDAIVVLTDGVDTTSDSPSELEQAAVAATTPVYFVAGNNRTRPTPFLRVREWRVPSVVRPNTEYGLEASFEAFSLSDRVVPLSLWSGSQRLAVGRIKLTRGTNLIPWHYSLTAGEPGLVDYSLRFGESASDPIVARSIVRIFKMPTRVLVYQSVLDWSEGFLASALRKDPDFQYLTLIDAKSGLRIATSSGWGGQIVGSLPPKAEAYANFDCVALLHLYPEKLTTEQQQALIDYVRGGGGVLFVSPDGDAVEQFAKSRLADLMPVVLPAGDVATRRNPYNGTVDFQPTVTGRTSPIFANAAQKTELIPRFVEFTPISIAKPGAEILAVHPDAVEAGRPYILLATQTFGRGHATLLATDGLWRWKMSQPSNSTNYDTFWQQLIIASARRADPDALRFARPLQGIVGHPSSLTLTGTSSAKTPTVHAKGPDGQRIELLVRSSPDAPASWTVDWTPDRSGAWELVAEQTNAAPAYLYLTAVTEPTGELANTPPAFESMRAIATATGGALLGREPPAAWLPASLTSNKSEKTPDPITTERRRLRWNQWRVLWLALGIYGLELVLRRAWKLV